MGFPLLDNYIEKYGPAAQELGLTVRAYADRVIARLDCIHGELQSANNDSKAYDQIHGVFDWDGDVASNGTIVRIGTVPRDQIWIIEAVSRGDFEVAGSPNTPNVYFYQNGVLRADFATTWPSGTGTPNARITGPSDLTMKVTNMGGPIHVYVQLRKLIPVVGRQKLAQSGFGEPEFQVDRMGMADEYRHTGSLNGNHAVSPE